MIEILPESLGDVFGIRARGKLTNQDYEEILIPGLETIIRKYGHVRVLCDMGEDFHGWELKAMWADGKFGLAHRKDFEKFAIVGGNRWVEWGAKLGALFMKTELRTFPHEQLQEAWSWIKA